jgi:hypothetical protein
MAEQAMDNSRGQTLWRQPAAPGSHLNAKSIGLTIRLADVTEEEFWVLELIETETGANQGWGR